MTREEAIRIFRKEMECLSHTKCEDCILEKACDPMTTTPFDSEYIEAYNMAIKALEQEPTTKNNLVVDCIERAEVLKLMQDNWHTHNGDWAMQESMDDIRALPSVTPQEPRWIPVNERVAEFPCLACDIFDQIFIPSGIVVLNSRCYEGKDFDFNVEKFLRGKEVIMCGGKKAYLRPREIAAWMPLPKPYEPMESEG